MSRAQVALAVLMASAGLAGCLQADARLSPDFGMALKQNLAAQVADPEAVYERAIEPASDGQRAAAAGDRYARGEVKRLQAQSTNTVSGSASGGAGVGASASGGSR